MTSRAVVIAASICAVAWLSLSPVYAAEQVKYSVTSLSEFQQAFGRLAKDEGDALAEYTLLRSLYRNLEGMEKNQASQWLSMVDAMFGRYQDAENHYLTAFPSANQPIKCPTIGATAQPAHEALQLLISNAEIVMINESHSFVRTRSFLYSILPTLKKLGFNYLALEALAPASDALLQGSFSPSLYDTSLPSRGYPLDRSSAGLYLREPVYAELVREAVDLGFKLIAYETLSAGSRAEREDGQAKALAKVIDADPNSKIAVIAGYSHIWKADGWMADRLQRRTGRKILSIDQTAGLAGCDGPAGDGSKSAYIMTDADGKAWSMKPDRVDVTVIHVPSKDGRTEDDGWLTLGGQRRGTKPDVSACIEAWPCLVSAFYTDEERNSVPADRLLLDRQDVNALLFLKSGTYRYVVQPHGMPAITRELTIR